MHIIQEANFSDADISILISFAKENGGIDYAYNKIEVFRKKAIEIIDTLENGEVKDALINAVEYVVERVY